MEGWREDLVLGIVFKGMAAVAHFPLLYLTFSKVPLLPKIASPVGDQTLTT